jgi:hypothetical protein
MKTKIFIFLICNLVICNLLIAQSINLTLGSGGVFTIKDASTNYFTLSQSTGQVNIIKSLRLENTSGLGTGAIYFGPNRFIHNYGIQNTFLGTNAGNFTLVALLSGNTGIGYSSLLSLTTGDASTALGCNSLRNNTSGNNNTAIGYSSLIFNTSGSNNTAVGKMSLFSNTTGVFNTALGNLSLYSNITGFSNTAVGLQSLYFNTSGNNNTAVGDSSLFSNTTGLQNTAVGNQTLYSNTTGQLNTAIGTGSLYNNTTGDFNTTLGGYSLQSNITGIGNTTVGMFSLPFNVTGNDNTSVGMNSLYNNVSGNYNTAVGRSSLTFVSSGNNNTAIGFNAQVPDGIASNQVRIGNTFITYAGIQVPWTITSDRRWKSDIQNSGLGLGFISKLRPVSYFRNNDDSKKTEYGFIAQEVEEVLKEAGTENTGMITVTDEGMYELRYNDLLAPMVKAIQELNEKCTTLEAENSQLKDEVESLKDMRVKLAELEQSQLELIKIIKSNNSKEIQSVKITDNK